MIAGLDSVDDAVLRLSHEASEETGVLVTVYTRFPEILMDALAWSRRPLHQLLAEFPSHVVARLELLRQELRLQKAALPIATTPIDRSNMPVSRQFAIYSVS